jgi:hypothetical protein
VLLHTTDAGGTWSPEGARIAVQSPRGIDVIAADGTGRRKVAAAGAAGPRWSSDGMRIALERSHCTPGLKGLCGLILHSLYVVGADGRGERRLTGPISGGPGSHVDGVPNDDSAAPAWWPGDAQLFFRRRGRAYTMNADGTCERPFGPADRQLAAPAWRPGSKPSTSPVRCVELRLRAVAERNPVGLRGHARVHVTVENDGNETATATRLTLRRVYGRGRIVPPLSSCRGALPVVCDLAPLTAGTARRLVVDVADRTPVGFRLQATVTSAQADPDPSTNTSVAFVDVLDCDIVGTAQGDRLVGTAGRDKICGLQGNDLIRAGAGNDTIIGGAGSDRIECGPGRDIVVVTGRIDTVARDCERVVRG